MKKKKKKEKEKPPEPSAAAHYYYYYYCRTGSRSIGVRIMYIMGIRYHALDISDTTNCAYNIKRIDVI